ncbi:hypothetical protein [Sunxiuqinia dokdonensis]|uniref:Uncharacterized protein n=1 Tax=Sunxiuqinia dokdonensis TaxID=1409788 RepID=A0A0L8V8G5_9BACT|nr:hypothetical protein [Sunxiuqinia dokdonensis]KOH44729.1 hypothetical protein NC99_24680 [Sunxiuqinia dokdonensis]
MSSTMFFLPFLIGFIYLAIFAGVLYLIHTWVTKFVRLKQEYNDLLREIIRKMDRPTDGTFNRNE